MSVIRRLSACVAVSSFAIWGISPVYSACTVYHDVNYGGRSAVLGGGAAWNYIGDAFNDKVSSIRLTRGCTFTAFEHKEFGGRSRVFSANTTFVGADWNDRISSAKCSCAVVIDGGGSPEQI